MVALTVFLFTQEILNRTFWIFSESVIQLKMLSAGVAIFSIYVGYGINSLILKNHNQKNTKNIKEHLPYLASVVIILALTSVYFSNNLKKIEVELGGVNNLFKNGEYSKAQGKCLSIVFGGRDARYFGPVLPYIYSEKYEILYTKDSQLYSQVYYCVALASCYLNDRSNYHEYTARLLIGYKEYSKFFEKKLEDSNCPVGAGDLPSNPPSSASLF